MSNYMKYDWISTLHLISQYIVIHIEKFGYTALRFFLWYPALPSLKHFQKNNKKTTQSDIKCHKINRAIKKPLEFKNYTYVFFI